ncbi:MAG TPA: SDR family oxidoreductase, partial [Mycobacterium sp.]|nr:SDR family oxidoreductase [Mycobacterium sp.]
MREQRGHRWNAETPSTVRAGRTFARLNPTHERGCTMGFAPQQQTVPDPTLAPYAATKAAIANFSASLAQLLGDKGIRVSSVAPGPIWTPLIPSTMPPKSVESFGQNVPLGRAGQPAELAPNSLTRLRRQHDRCSSAVK